MTIEETIDELRNQFAIMEDARAAIPRNTMGIDPAYSKWNREQATLEVMLRQAWPKIDAALAERERLRAENEQLRITNVQLRNMFSAVNIIAPFALGGQP